MYTPIKYDDIALIKWKEKSYKGTRLYIGSVNDFIFAVCTENTTTENIAIRFRVKNYYPPNVSSPIKGSHGVIGVYRYGWALDDLREGLWLTSEELNNVNSAIEKMLFQKKLDFILIK
jgi:hypothetical protein